MKWVNHWATCPRWCLVSAHILMFVLVTLSLECKVLTLEDLKEHNSEVTVETFFWKLVFFCRNSNNLFFLFQKRQSRYVSSLSFLIYLLFSHFKQQYDLHSLDICFLKIRRPRFWVISPVAYIMQTRLGESKIFLKGFSQKKFVEK